MYIKNINLVNFKRIESLQAEFKGGVYIITGENEYGKTTLLNAINTLLSGERSNNLLRKGESKGSASIEVGDETINYKVELVFTEANPRGTLKITDHNGFASSNISMLQKIFNYHNFDAHEFISWSETADGRRKQIEIVMSLFDPQTQSRIKEIDREVARLKEARKPISLSAKEYRSIADKTVVQCTIEENEALIGYKPIDTNELVSKLTNATQKNEARNQFLEKMSAKRTLLENISEDKKKKQFGTLSEIEELQAQMEVLKAKISAKQDSLSSIDTEFANLKTETETAIKSGEEWLAANPKIEIEEIEASIAKATRLNALHTKSEERVKHIETAEGKEAQVEEMNKSITMLSEERIELIRTDKLPIAGLSFDEDGLTLDGIPFRHGEVSTSQEMEVAMKLIIAKNPTVRVFKVGQGESLGRRRLQAIVDYANANGFQGFIEQVERGQEELRIEQYQEKEVE